MDIEFSSELIAAMTCISIFHLIYTIIVWSTLFTSKGMIMIFFKIFIFFFGLGMTMMIQMYNCKQDDLRTKILPCAMLGMIIFSCCVDILCGVGVIHKGFSDCVGEIIALIFGIIFTALWIGAYFITNDHVQQEFGDKMDAAVAEKKAAAPV